MKHGAIAALIVSGILPAKALTISAEQLFAAAERALKESCAGYGDIQCVAIGRLRPVEGAASTSAVISARMVQAARIPGVVTVTLDIFAGERPPQTIRIPVRVALVRTVPVAARNIRRGDVIQPTDLQILSEAMTALPRGLITEPERIVGMRARCSIACGSPFYERSLEELPMVRNRETIEVRTTAGNCRLTFAARARQDGRLGDRIKVINPANNRMIWAVVTGPGTAEIRRAP